MTVEETKAPVDLNTQNGNFRVNSFSVGKQNDDSIPLYSKKENPTIYTNSIHDKFNETRMSQEQLTPNLD